MRQLSAAGTLITVTDASFAETVLAADRPVVVEVWAEWCPPCVKIAPILAELAAEFGDRMTIAKLNADENPQTTRAYRVVSVPTLLVFRGGEVVGTIVGAKPKAALRELILGYAE
ncbi:MAG TPA: thioredoxin [Micromonospora sp.]